MTQYVFGTGQLFSMPIGGGAPLKFGALQDVSTDFSGDIKQLHGQYQYPLDVARGKAKVEWKAGSGNIDVAAFNSVFFNDTITEDAELIQVFNEAGTVPAASGPYTITVANAADFEMDLGVTLDDGTPLKQVPATPGPQTGEYSVSSAGVYTFAAVDTGKKVLITYIYEKNSGGSLTISNKLMGSAPRFQLVLSQVYAGKTFTLVLYSNVADKLSLPLKQDDYLIGEISGQAFANDAGQVGRMTTTSVSGGGG